MLPTLAICKQPAYVLISMHRPPLISTDYRHSTASLSTVTSVVGTTCPGVRVSGWSGTRVSVLVITTDDRDTDGDSDGGSNGEAGMITAVGDGGRRSVA